MRGNAIIERLDQMFEQKILRIFFYASILCFLASCAIAGGLLYAEEILDCRESVNPPIPGVSEANALGFVLGGIFNMYFFSQMISKIGVATYDSLKDESLGGFNPRLIEYPVPLTVAQLSFFFWVSIFAVQTFLFPIISYSLALPILAECIYSK